MSVQSPPARFVRVSAPHDVQCPLAHHISQRQRTIEASLLRCKECGQWLYAVAPRTGTTELAVKMVLTCALSTDEMTRIERERLNPFEALLYLRVIDLAALTIALPVVLFSSSGEWRFRDRRRGDRRSSAVTVVSQAKSA